jgi:putative hydrolase of the HAD superfamily
MIRAIFFDLDGTLIDRAALWRRCLSGFLADRGLALCDDAEVAEALRSPFTDWPRMARVLGRAVPGLAMSRGEIGRALRERMLRSAEPDGEVNAVVGDLARRYRTAIVTNGSARVQWAKIVGAALHTWPDEVFISGQMGVRKPDPAFFERVLAWARVSPAEALIVGDHPYDDIFGGQRAGLLTCAVGDRYDDSWPRPDFRISRFADLPRALG